MVAPVECRVASHPRRVALDLQLEGQPRRSRGAAQRHRAIGQIAAFALAGQDIGLETGGGEG